MTLTKEALYEMISQLLEQYKRQPLPLCLAHLTID